MAKAHVEAWVVIAARPDDIYAVISDYRVGHPAILPKTYFKNLTVEEGGKGAGTVLRIEMEVFGRKSHYHLRVAEPEPGRVLVEAEMDDSLATTFTLEPIGDGSQTRVTIRTDFTPSPGIPGWVERWMNPPVMRNIYKQELRQLAETMQARPSAAR